MYEQFEQITLQNNLDLKRNYRNRYFIFFSKNKNLFSSRYYDYRELEAAGLKYSKIMTMGHSIPNHGVIQQFFKSVNSFLAEDPSKLIGCILFHYFLVFIICFLFISLQSHLKERNSIDHTRYVHTTHHKNIWNINQRKRTLWRLGYPKIILLDDPKSK